MSFDGSGVYSLTYTWATEAASPPIAISKLDTEMAGIATGLSLCVLRNGNGVPTADTPWNDKKITGLADATAATDALNRQTADTRYGVKSSGSFTMRMTNVLDNTNYATGTAYWTLQGNIAVVRLPYLVATTTATTLYLRGFPSDITPSLTGNVWQSIVCPGYINGNHAAVAVDVGETTYWQVRAMTTAFDGSNTAKGIGGNETAIAPVITFMVAD